MEMNGHGQFFLKGSNEVVSCLWRHEPGHIFYVNGRRTHGNLVLGILDIAFNRIERTDVVLQGPFNDLPGLFDGIKSRFTVPEVA